MGKHSSHDKCKYHINHINGVKKRIIKQNKEKKERIKEYLKNPKRCPQCSHGLDYNKRFNKFCSRSCSGTYNNIKYPKRTNKKPKPNCLNCNTVLNRYNSKYCNSKCQQDFQWNEKKKLILNGTLNNANAIKKYLIELYGEKCMECGWDKKNKYSNKIPIELEHIDGNSNNNNLDNCKILCPNCHSLTPTYKALNKGSGRFKRMQRYHSGKSF